MYKTLIEAIEDSQSIAISGHIRPDGDCVGSTTALYNYIKKNYPDKTVRLFLERIPPEMAAVITAPEPLNGEEWDEKFDLFVSLDASTPDRLGPNLRLFQEAGYRFVVDHHVTNRGFGDTNHIVGEAASCCEVLFDLLEEDKIDVEVGKCIYLGIVHDTGVFKFPSTSRHTMEVAGILVECQSRSQHAATGVRQAYHIKVSLQNTVLTRCAVNRDIREIEGVLHAPARKRKIILVNRTSLRHHFIIERLVRAHDIIGNGHPIFTVKHYDRTIVALFVHKGIDTRSGT